MRMGMMRANYMFESDAILHRDEQNIFTEYVLSSLQISTVVVVKGI